LATRVIEWDGARLPDELKDLLPDQLRDLPAGQYVIEPVEDDLDLTPDERAGILEAMDDLDQGRGIPFDAVKRELRERYSGT
jgi:hypothetical protein